MREQKGITLVALVITIIVLLILAGVTIAALSGPNGILSNSVKSNEETAMAQAKEAVSMAVSEVLTDYYVTQTTNSGTPQDLSKETVEASLTKNYPDFKNPIVTEPATGSNSGTVTMEINGIKVSVPFTVTEPTGSGASTWTLGEASIVD